MHPVSELRKWGQMCPFDALHRGTDEQQVSKAALKLAGVGRAEEQTCRGGAAEGMGRSSSCGAPVSQRGNELPKPWGCPDSGSAESEQLNGLTRLRGPSFRALPHPGLSFLEKHLPDCRGAGERADQMASQSPPSRETSGAMSHPHLRIGCRLPGVPPPSSTCPRASCRHTPPVPLAPWSRPPCPGSQVYTADLSRGARSEWPGRLLWTPHHSLTPRCLRFSPEIGGRGESRTMSPWPPASFPVPAAVSCWGLRGLQ